MIPESIKCRPRLYNFLHRMGVVPAYSQTSEAERDCLSRYACNKKTAIEIGTFMGVTAGLIAGVLAPEGRLYCVDPYVNGESLLQIMRRHLRRCGILNKIVMVRSYSSSALPQIPDNADFIFVDGNHSFEGLQTDWNLVKAKLAIGGIACFHDTSRPPERPDMICGAIDFFEAHIRHAHGFRHLETCHSLNVIIRLA